MTAIVDSATSRDGLRLVTRHWSAASPLAAVLLVHGLADHSGRWEAVGEQLAAAGLDAHAFDLRGWGASDGESAWVEDWRRYHDDVEDRLAATRAAVPGRPVVLYGHSMGGLIALGYVLSGRPSPDLLVLSAPAVIDRAARWKHLVAPAAARLVPHTRFPNDIGAELLSRDPARQAAVRADPLVPTASTAGFGARFFAEQDRVRAEMADRGSNRPAIPTLVIHGLADPLVPAASSEPLARLPNVTRRTYDGIRHELHNEPEGPRILADVIAWIEARLGDSSLARAGDPVASGPVPTGDGPVTV